MNISGIQNGLVGMAVFDIYMNALRKANKARRHRDAAQACPMVTAACDAFEQYLAIEEVGHQAQIAAVATYALQPNGKAVSGLSAQQTAPFLALNILA